MSFSLSSPSPRHHHPLANGDLAPFNTDRLSLPESPPRLHLLDFLPPAIAQLYASPSGLIDQPASLLQQPPRPYHAPRGAEELRFIKRMLDLEMFDLQHWQPGMTEVGYFAVKKDDKLRLIADGRPANARRTGGIPLDVHLPTPEDLAALHVPPGSRLLKFKHDVSAMFHRFIVPPWLQLLFCLAGLSPDQLRAIGRDPFGPNIPVLRTLAMGWIDAVFLMQCVMERLMSKVISPTRFLTAGPTLASGPVLAIYIDDTIGAGLSPRDDRVMRVLDNNVAAVLADHGVPEKFEKHVPATIAPMDALGCELLANRIAPTPKRKLALFSKTRAVLAAGSVRGIDLEPLLGLWAWAFLLCRPAFSIFHASYRFCAVAGDRVFVLWPSVRRELVIALALLPFIEAPLSLPLASRRYASDASSDHGGALVSMPRSQSSCRLWLWRLEWARRWMWLGDHINELEIRALLPAYERHLSRRILLLTDSSVAVGALSKGRSPSWRINLLARRSLALRLLTGNILLLHHIPSVLNPADAHSRGYRSASVRRFSAPRIHDVP